MDRQFGLIGRKLSHSASSIYFNDKFKSEGILDCKYDLYELPSVNEFPYLLASLPNLCGLNVTIPFKQEILPYLNQLSTDAQQVGAVNCIRKERNGELTGYNTDIVGLRASLDELLRDSTHDNALILGSGGASQAVQYVLAERGISFKIVSRERSRGDLIYDEVTLEVIGDNKLIINTSPLGMFPDINASPAIPYEAITPSHILFDLVYNPHLTQFLDYGRQRGARIMNGELMFRTQAEASWKIWNKIL